jgi:hypothetical protein
VALLLEVLEKGRADLVRSHRLSFYKTGRTSRFRDTNVPPSTIINHRLITPGLLDTMGIHRGSIRSSRSSATDTDSAIKRTWRNHVNEGREDRKEESFRKRYFARFAIFAFNVILSHALKPSRYE